MTLRYAIPGRETVVPSKRTFLAGLMRSRRVIKSEAYGARRRMVRDKVRGHQGPHCYYCSRWHVYARRQKYRID